MNSQQPDHKASKLLQALMFALLALSYLGLKIVFILLMVTTLVSLIFSAKVVGFDPAHLIMLTTGTMLLLVAAKPSMRNLDGWVDKEIKKYEDA